MRRLKVIIKQILFYLLSGSKGYADLKILSGQAKGVKLRIDIRKEGSYYLGIYDKWIFDRINFKDFIKPGMVMWDCGAYIGYYTAVFRKCIGEIGQIYVFEASTKNYNAVKVIPKLNNWENVTIVNCALGPEDTILKFADNLGGSNGPVGLSKTYDAALDVIEVACYGVDELVDTQKIAAPDFIKFDLESAEVFALHNGDKVFGQKRPILLLELHGEEAFQAAGSFLSKYNYRAAYVGHFPKPDKWFYNLFDLEQLGFIPHMIMCLPN